MRAASVETMTGDLAGFNGQTIYSECNKAKHYAKAYLGMVARLASS
jgi:hypothetical protein